MAAQRNVLVGIFFHYWKYSFYRKQTLILTTLYAIDAYNQLI